MRLNDDEANALILARETSASLRAITGLDTLSAANQVLRKLHHQRELLVQGGASSATYYQLRNLPEIPLFGDANTGDLESNTGDLPPELLAAIHALTSKARQDKLWPLVLWACAIRPHSADQLANLFGRKVKALKAGHLNALREKQGWLEYTHPEVINHPQ